MRCLHGSWKRGVALASSVCGRGLTRWRGMPVKLIPVRKCRLCGFSLSLLALALLGARCAVDPRPEPPNTYLNPCPVPAEANAEYKVRLRWGVHPDQWHYTDHEYRGDTCIYTHPATHISLWGQCTLHRVETLAPDEAISTLPWQKAEVDAALVVEKCGGGE